jgi:hypothetical protein
MPGAIRAAAWGRGHRLEGGDPVGVDPDAVALVTELGGVVPLVDGGADPGPSQSLGQGEAADTGADDDDMRI